MTLHLRVGGAWKAVTDPRIKVSGAYKNVTDGWIKVGGVWKRFYQRTTTTTLQSIIAAAGLTTGLEFSIDAAALASYAGSGQQISDLSGGANHFNRGGDGTSESSDPNFNGTAGAGDSSNYFSFDGGDKVTIGANTNALRDLHKDNGKGTILLVCVHQYAGTFQQSLFDTRNGSQQHGMQIYLAATYSPPDKVFPEGFQNLDVRIQARNTGNARDASMLAGGNASYSPAGAVSFIFASWDEASANSGQFIVNEQAMANQAMSYTSPSTTNATALTLLNDTAPGVSGISGGSRLHQAAFWNTNLSMANGKALQAAIKSAYGYGWTNAP